MVDTKNMQELKACSLYEWLTHWDMEKPEEIALVVAGKNKGQKTYTWRELKGLTDKVAWSLHQRGIMTGSGMVIAMSNSVAAVAAALAAWHLGCCVYFLSWELPEKELGLLLEQIQPQMVLSPGKHGSWPCMDLSAKAIGELPEPGGVLPDVDHVPARATATGGSTGVPKVIVEEAPLRYGEKDFARWQQLTGQHPGQRQIICGSLHHSLFGNSFYMALAMGNTQVLMRQFDPELFISLVKQYHISAFVLVPIMMSRVIRSGAMAQADFSSVECMHHAGAACPPWLKDEWIELLGGEKVYEFYSMSEKVGMTGIRGDQWLQHKGSVGKPFGCTIEILDQDLQPMIPGQIGNVYFKDFSSSSHYLMDDQQLAMGPNSAVTVGDMGYLDEEGYLYLVDRRSDMMITGGKNVFAAEVEGLLRQFPQVEDALVVGLPDPTWGQRVHAILELNCPPEKFKLYSFADFCFRRLSNYKLPKTLELVETMPRDQSGKVNKNKLIELRKLNPDSFDIRKVPNGPQIMAWRKKKAREKKA